MKLTVGTKTALSANVSLASSCKKRALHRFARYLIVLAVVCYVWQFGFDVRNHALAADDPRVTGITVRKVTTSDDKTKVTLALEISGDNFGPTTTPVVVKLINLETGADIDVSVSTHDNNLIVAGIQLPIAKKPVKYQFRVSVAGKNAVPPERLSDFTLEVGKEEKKVEAPTPFEISYETFKSEEYPNLHSLVITNKNQNNKPGFSPNPALMKVDIVPPGATNISVQPGSSPYQMFVTFLASEKFEVKGVSVTVFDPNSTLGNNSPVAFTTPFIKDKPVKADANQPTISGIEILSMQRHSGYGRLRILGSGFGDYERPPISGEKELLCCLNRPSNPDIATEQGDRQSRDADTGKITILDTEVCKFAETKKCDKMAEWRRRVEDRVNVTLVPRNVDLRVERTQITYIDDKLIDVYFEFTYFAGYSYPLRLASASVTVNKGAAQQARTSDEAGEITAVLSSPRTFVASKEVGPPRDGNLEYRYALLHQRDAKRLFGQGVGDNFFVIELTVVNKNPKKKVNVPLGSIQAETVWAYGGPVNSEFFEEGPETLPPLPLGAVTGYFDAYQKSQGKWAKIFNILDGVTTLGTSLVPVFGRNIERPVTILAGGFIPGLHKAVGDLSSEQLQRLTSMSWEGVEEIAPGNSKMKFIYIPRADQYYGNPVKTKGSKMLKTRKQVLNIVGLEVNGFEVTESEEKAATKTDQ
ncbi:MAG TPA: hypothetical protein VGN90_00245 [Pyrinomonadaceae bacterium]|jgi:hypothetical protein|nr:hypothetical protein [Pyrinomonadaceae bacterium]